MKLNEGYFYCFGCGATGDVIDLVARLFDLSSYEAAQKLAQDFGIGPDKPPAAAALPKTERPLLKAYRQEEVRCLRVLCDYLHLLEGWKQNYAPSHPDETGVPNGTQQSGSVGERTSSGTSELSALAGSEGCGVCEDAVRTYALIDRCSLFYSNSAAMTVRITGQIPMLNQGK